MEFSLSEELLWPRCLLRGWEFVEGAIVSEACVVRVSCRSNSSHWKVSVLREGSESMVR